MATTLSQQLKALAVPQSSAFEVDRHHRASFLFNPKDAANIDRDAVYALGINGLQELATIDAWFDQELSEDGVLFSDNSVSIQRATMTREENAGLDVALNKFLLKLCPYFLLKASHKALEWLVYRFHVHEYNVPALMRCVLPYHETNFFVRVVQLVNFVHAQEWCWMEPLKKSGLSLSRSDLVKQCCSDSRLLEFICENIVEKFVESIPTDQLSKASLVFTFCASILDGVLVHVNQDEAAGSRLNAVLSQIVPFVVDGLRSGVTDWLLASCVVIGRMCHVTTLTDMVYSSLLKELFRVNQPPHYAVILSAAAIVCETQPVEKLPKKAFSRLCQWFPNEWVPLLDALGRRKCCDKLVSLIGKELVGSAVEFAKSGPGNESKMKMATERLHIFFKLSFSAPVAREITRYLFEILTNVFDSVADEDGPALTIVEETFSMPVTLLCRRYPSIWDNVVDQQESSPHVDRVVGLISGINDSLFISVSHAKAQVRAQAVDKLADLVVGNKDIDDCEKVRIVSVLSARWVDSHPLVLLKLLAHAEIFFDDPDLLRQLIGLVEENKQNDSLCNKMWRKLQLKALDTILCKAYTKSLKDGQVVEISMFCLQKLFRVQFARKFQRKIAQTILNSHFVKVHFCGCFDDMKLVDESKTDASESFSALFMKAVCKWINALSIDEQARYFGTSQESSEAAHLTQAPILYTAALVWNLDDPSNANSEKLTFIFNFLKLFPDVLYKPTSLSICSPDPDLADLISKSTHENFSLIVNFRSLLGRYGKRNEHKPISWELQMAVVWRIFKCIWPLVTPRRYLFSSKHSDLTDFVNNDLICYAVELLACGISLDPIRAKFVLLDFIETFFADPKSIICIISLMLMKLNGFCSSVTVGLPSHALELILKTFSSCLRSMSVEKFTKSLDSAVYPLLLICCGCDGLALRRAAGTCWSVLLDLTPDADAVRNLAAFVNGRIREIQDDQNQIKEVIAQFYNYKVRSAANKGTVLSLWTEVTSDTTPIPVSIMLARIFSNIRDQTLLSKTLSKLNMLLDQVALTNPENVDQREKWNHILLHVLVQKFAYPACAILKTDKKAMETFMLFLKVQVKLPADSSDDGDSFPSLNVIDLNFCQSVGPDIVTLMFRQLFEQTVDAKLKLLGGATHVLASVHTDVIVKKLILMPISCAELKSSLVGQIDTMKKALEPFAVSPGKRRKTNSQSSSLGGASSVSDYSTPTEEPGEAMRRSHASYLLTLEIIENGSNELFSNRLELVPVLFRLVKLVLDMKGVVSFNGIDYGYLLNLSLSVLAQLCSTEIAKTHLHEKDFMVDTLVRVVRECDSQRTHQLALELLTHVAGILREHVVHHIMSIFTFMGSSLFRQDDQYSFSVIQRTIATVIPAVVESSRSRTRSQSQDASHTLAKIIGDIFQIFVAARQDIAAHRKMPLFKQLVEATSVSAPKLMMNSEVGIIQSAPAEETAPSCSLDKNVGQSTARDCLWIMVGQIMKLGVESSAAVANGESLGKPLSANRARKSQVVEYLEFSVQLALQFSPTEQILCCTKLMSLFNALPVSLENPSAPKLDNTARSLKAEFESVFPASRFTNDHILHAFRQNLFRFCRFLVGSSDFLASVSALGPGDYSAFVNSCEGLVEHLLRGAASCQAVLDACSNELQSVAEMFRGYLADVRGILDQLNSLLPATTCLSIVYGLLSNADPILNRFGMELMDTKLQQNPTPFTQENVKELSNICTLLTKSIQNSCAWNWKQCGEDQLIALQMSLFTIKLLTKVIGPFEPTCLNEALVVVVQFLHNWQAVSKPVLIGNGLLALSELSITLGTSAVPAMNNFVPDVLDIFADTIDEKSRSKDTKDSELLFASCLFALERMFTPFANFLGPYFVRILHLACCSVDLLADCRAKVTARMASLTERLSAQPPRVLLPVLLEVIREKLKSRKLDGLEYLCNLLVRHLGKQDVDSLTSGDAVTLLSPLFCELFDLRKYEYFNWDVSATFDALAAEAFVSLSLKLSESKFRPILNQMSQWVSESAAMEHRYLSFFCALELLSDKLMSLFLIFAGPLLVVCSELLPRLVEVDKKLKSSVKQQLFGSSKSAPADGARARRHLLCQVLAVLSNTFKHSGHKFLNTDRVEMLSPHIISLIDSHRIDEFDEFVVRNLRPCLVSFGVAITDQAMLKSFNHQILLKTRSTLPKVRLAALKILGELYSRLGDALSRLIPETIPFVAELIEDENEEVESECRAVMNVIESVSGELLDNYL